MKLNGNSSGKLLILTKTAPSYATSFNESFNYLIVSFILFLRKNFDFNA